MRNKEQHIVFQRLEGLAIMVAALMAHDYFGFSWLQFALFFLVFDISILGYVHSHKIGAYVYNVVHSYFLPAILLAVWIQVQNDTLLFVLLIWFSHIGFDRLFGYGLKLNTHFRHTHLGPIGKKH